MSSRPPIQLPRELATEILDRAAKLDAGDERIDLATLRSAAVDAGISADAFERALVESISMSPRPARRHIAEGEANAANLFELGAKMTMVGTAAGLLAIAVVSLLVGDGPGEDAMLGAAVGGFGAIAGLVAYVWRKVKR